MRLAVLHFGADMVQEVRSTHGGDLGIEGFTYDGHAFQCYVAEEPLETKKRYENQRDKLSEDLAKLASKRDDFVRLLGAVKLDCYFFLIPYWNSKALVAHAQAKTAEVKGWNLSFVNNSKFRIVVTDDDAFPNAKRVALDKPTRLVSAYDATQQDVDHWIGNNADLVRNIDGKLSRVFNDQAKRRKYMESLVLNYIESSNMLDQLRSRYPDQWEAAIGCIKAKEKLLELEHLDTVLPPSTSIVKEIVQQLHLDLSREVGAVGDPAGKKVAWGAIADWLIRCPLDWPAPDSELS